MAERIRCVAASTEHAAGLAEFFRINWGAQTTPDEVVRSMETSAAENVAEPGRIPPATIAVRGGEVLAYCGSIPTQFRLCGSTQSAYWAKGLWVLEQYRGGPLGYMVLKEFSASVEIAAALTVDPASRRLFEGLGYQNLGTLPNLVQPVSFERLGRHMRGIVERQANLPSVVRRGARVVDTLGIGRAGGMMADAMVWMLRAVRPSRYEVAMAPDITDDALHHLWDRSRDAAPASPVRDAHALRTRYQLGMPKSEYFPIVARREGELVGLAIMKRPKAMPDGRLGGVSAASLSDILALPNQPGLDAALLDGCYGAARAEGAAAIVFSPALQRWRDSARRLGYFAMPGNVHFLLKHPAAAGTVPGVLNQWHLTRGDAESDASF
ncbi:hypothetical protein [Gemmatimonas sp.]|uniref:hypothetical protein n=1 Tax=Gemmatimonas sp. TaxID=1962908 RepID=UPI002EDA698F